MENESNQISLTYAIANLKSFLTFWVVVHHSILAYSSYKAGSPIQDIHSTFVGFDFLVGIFDYFAMFLFFFLSGLFVWKSLEKRGSGKYLKNRVLRLFVPLVVGLFTLNLMVHALQVASGLLGNSDFWSLFKKGFFDGFGTHSYQLWYLWLLFIFDFVISGFYIIYKKKPSFWERLAKPLSSTKILLSSFLVCTIIAFAPITMAIGESFVFAGIGLLQANRILIYFLYFILGVFVGRNGLDDTFLATKNGFTKVAWRKLLGGLLLFGVWAVLSGVGGFYKIVATCLAPIFIFLFAFGFCNLFLRSANKTNLLLENLSKNNFGIYINHYIVVALLQFGFLFVSISPILKALCVVVLGCIFSWLLSDGWRRLKQLLIKRK